MRIFNAISAWFDRQSGTTKALVGVGVVGAVTLAAQSASAQVRAPSAPRGPQPPAGTRVGEAHRALAPGWLVRLPEEAHLRMAPRAAVTSSDVTAPAGTIVEIVSGPVAGMARGPNETAYEVRAYVAFTNPTPTRRFSAPNAGWIFVPNNAVFAVRPT